MIIDFHTHTFPDKIAAKTVQHLAGISHSHPFTDGSVGGLIASMKKAGIDYSVNLPVMTSAGQVEKVNHSLAEQREALLKQGVITFGGMHPEYEDYKSELRFLRDHHIPGIKLHPAYQGVDLDDIRMLRIIDAASELGLIVLIHAGIDIGIYDHNYSSTEHILTVMREVAPPKFVLAHMGNWACWDEVERDLAGAPLWLDTAFALGSITPREGDPHPTYLPANMSDEAFVRLARKHGTDHILFATDSPWESQKDYIRRIDALPLTLKEKEQIFGGNAQALLH